MTILEELSSHEFFLYYYAGRARIGPVHNSMNCWIFSEFLGRQQARLTLGTRWFSLDEDGEIAESPVRIIQLGMTFNLFNNNKRIKEIITFIRREKSSKKKLFSRSRPDRF